MKALPKILTVILLTVFSALQLAARGPENLVAVDGIVIDQHSKKKLSYVTVSVPETNITTVSNADGSFVIKIPVELDKKGLYLSRMGYRSKLVSWNEIERNGLKLTIALEQAPRQLDEVVVHDAGPVEEIVASALRKIPRNYADSSNVFQAFYRETIRKGRRYVSIGEGVFEVFKTPYKVRRIGKDRVKISKGRRLLNQKGSDTLAVKVMGGPVISLVLDVVKNEDALLIPREIEFYEFTMKPGMLIDDRPQYVIEFEPRVRLNYEMYRGTLYIDRATEAITRAEFEMVLSDKDRVTGNILKKKPPRLRFTPQEISAVATYRFINGRSYLHYISSRLRFRCDWKRRLFSSGYTVDTEMVMVDREETDPSAVSVMDFRKNMIFEEMVDEFDDKNFWQNYNIIEPTESLEKAVARLRKTSSR